MGNVMHYKCALDRINTREFFLKAEQILSDHAFGIDKKVIYSMNLNNPNI